MYRNFFCVLVTIGFALISSVASAGEDKTPFDDYERITPEIFVTDQSLSKKHTGPDVTSRDDPEYIERKRLVKVLLAPAKWIYIDEVTDPAYRYLELRDAKSGALIFKLPSRGDIMGSFLFNGEGTVYLYDVPDNHMCDVGRETRKYQYKNGSLVEVKQPLVLVQDAKTTVNQPLKLYLEPKEGSPQVAALNDAEVQILVVEKDDWFLIKTPLGLTGWVHGGLAVHGCG